MKKNNHWETLIWVIIIVVIITIIMLSLSKIIEYDNNLSFDYNKANYTMLLDKNTSKIVSKIDTLWFNENDELYIYKTWSSIKVFSWSINNSYKYINYLGEGVNTWSYNWIVYTRVCNIEKDIENWQIINCLINEFKE